MISRRGFLKLSSAAAMAAQAPDPAWSSDFDPGAGVLTWPRGRALPVFPRASHLESADLSALDGDEQGLLVSLQGIVNRRRPRLYLYWGSDPTNAEWLNTLDLPGRVTTEPWSIFDRFRSEINGAVVYDPAVPDTINLATTLAGVHGGVIATAAQARSLTLPVLDDLRGRFADKFAVYEHAMGKVWPGLTKRLMAAISPSQTVQLPGVSWTTVLQVTQPVTDASNTGTYTADLTPFVKGKTVYVRFSDAYPGDGWGPSVQQVTVTADGATVASFQPGSAAETPFLFEDSGSQVATGDHRFADGSAFFVYRFTVPAGATAVTLSARMWNEYQVAATGMAPTVQMVNPLFRDYIVATSAPNFWLDPNVPQEATLLGEVLATFEPNSAYLGWFPNGDEMTGVTQCGNHGVYVVASDTFFNASAFSGVRAEIQDSQPAATPPQLANRIYLSLVLVEGDNIQYDQHRMRMMWDDPARGQLPLGWSVSVLLRDIAPSMLSYYQRTQTANDLLIAGPSGAGYTYPVTWPAADLPAFLKQTGRYMEATGMKVLFAYNRDNSTDEALSPQLVRQYKQAIPGLQGIVYNYETASQIGMVSGVPVATLLGVNDTTSGLAQLQAVAAGWDGKAPLFVAVGLESWNIMPADVVAMMNTLGSPFEAVRPDVFFTLYSQSLARAK